MISFSSQLRDILPQSIFWVYDSYSLKKHKTTPFLVKKSEKNSNNKKFQTKQQLQNINNFIVILFIFLVFFTRNTHKLWTRYNKFKHSTTISTIITTNFCKLATILKSHQILWQISCRNWQNDNKKLTMSIPNTKLCVLWLMKENTFLIHTHIQQHLSLFYDTFLDRIHFPQKFLSICHKSQQLFCKFSSFSIFLL